MAKNKDKDGDERYKGAFEEAALPKMRGGRRGRPPASLANLRPAWKKGESGNIAGQPKSVVELNRYVRDKLKAIYDDLERVYFDPQTCPRDKYYIATLLDARGMGRPAIGVFHGTTGGMGGLPPGHLPVDEEGGPSMLLLRADHESRDGKYKAQIQAELRKLEREEAEEKRAMDDHLATAKEALARGEDVPGTTRMLIEARAANGAKPAAARSQKG